MSSNRLGIALSTASQRYQRIGAQGLSIGL